MMIAHYTSFKQKLHLPLSCFTYFSCQMYAKFWKRIIHNYE